MAPRRTRTRTQTQSQRQRQRQCSRIEINIVNNAELRANAQNILTFIRESRPKNTSLTYSPKQKEFKVAF
jgi:hypothetical protein